MAKRVFCDFCEAEVYRRNPEGFHACTYFAQVGKVPISSFISIQFYKKNAREDFEKDMCDECVWKALDRIDPRNKIVQEEN